MKCYFIIFIISFCLLPFMITAVLHDLPDYIKKCHRYDPNVNKCLLNNTEALRPFLIHGLPELNFPALEPFIIPEIVLEQGTQALNFKASLRNVTVTGLSNYKFSQFDFNPETIEWFLKGTISPLHLEGEYIVQGKVLIAPIEGKGHFRCNVKNTTLSISQKAKTITKNDEPFLRTIYTNTSINVGGPQVTLEGLFGGNSQLNEVTNRVINDNINELFQEIRPVIEKVIQTLIKKTLLETLEKNVSYDKLYPPIK